MGSTARFPTRCVAVWLGFEKCAEHVWPFALETSVALETAPQQNFDSLLRFRPRQRGLERVEGAEEVVSGWQRNLVDEILRRRDSPSVERCNASRARVDESVQFRVWKRTIDVSVSLRSIGVEIVSTENDFERAAATG